MNKITFRKTRMLLSTGMFVVALSLIFSRFLVLPDWERGLFMGAGIGLLLMAIISGNFRATR